MIFKSFLFTLLFTISATVYGQDFRYEVFVSKTAGANMVNVDFQGVLPPASTANRILLETVETAALALPDGDILGSMFHNDEFLRAAGFRAQVIRNGDTGEISDF